MRSCISRGAWIAALLSTVLAADEPLAAQGRGPLSIDDVGMLMRLSGPAPSVMSEVRRRMVRDLCVTFPLDLAAEATLRSRGADQALIDAVRGACYAGAELAIESHPTGAEVLLDNQRLGVTPWRGRVASRPTAQLTVRSAEKSQTYDIRLDQRTRVRGFIALIEDTVAVPAVHSEADWATALNLENRWVPVSPEPANPGPYLGAHGAVVVFHFLGIPFGVAAGVAAVCYMPSEPCGLQREGGAAFLGGFSAGLVAGGVISWLSLRWIEARGQRRNEEAQERHREWYRSNEANRAAWISNHPELRAGIERERQARDAALRHNADVRARNARIPASYLTAEPVY